MQGKEMRIKRVPATPKKLETVRVAAYARVSADKDAAFHSLESQADYYEKYVATHPEWTLVRTYSDNAISGTVIERPEFQRMLGDCRTGKIDLIITKSITRFARNTVALLEAIRELKHLGIDVYFEKENMHSISPDGELLLTLLAMYAEEEARSASENQKWRVKKKFEQGKPWTGRMLGYDLMDGKLVIIPDEAEIVRQIFKDYNSGMGIMKIAKKLNEAGIPARTSDVWTRTTILYILANEKYTGDMILQKTYCPDFRTKKRVPNKGAVPQYEVTGSHQAIISKEDFEAAQRRLNDNRRGAKEQKEPHLFAGLIRCGSCGGHYCHRNSGQGKYRRPVWSCRRYAELGKNACASRAIREDILVEKTKKVLGAKTLTREILQDRLTDIVIATGNRLIYHFQDGAEKEVNWEYKSRRESWTPEMREKARQQTLERNKQKEGRKHYE